MGRWKLNNDGSRYYDPNDSGPDQTAPPSATPDAPVAPQYRGSGGAVGDIPTGGGTVGDILTRNSEGPGGITGHAQDPNFRQPGVSMPGPTDPKIQPVPFTLTPGDKGDWSMQGGATPLSGSSDAVLAGMQSMYGGAPTPSRTMSAMPAAPAMDATTALRMRLSRDPSNPLLGAIGSGQV